MVRAGCSLTIAAGLGGGLVLSLRLSQVFLPGRSSEITDAIMVLMFAAAIKLMGEDPTRDAAGSRDSAERAAVARTPWWSSALLRVYGRLTRNDPEQPVDLIFVVAGRMERKHYGLELFRAGLAPRLVISVGRFEVSKMGKLDRAVGDSLIALRDRTPPGERHFFVEMDNAGVKAGQVRLPRWSTYGEALALRRFLEDAGVGKVMVISNDLHLRRVALTYAKIFRELPVNFCFCPVPARFGFPAKPGWWTRPEDRRYVMKETWKLLGYKLILSGPAWASPWLMRLKDGYEGEAGE